MGDVTKIAWTDHTFNAWWGCDEVSPACDHCYARTLATRYGFDVWGHDKPRRMLSDGYWRKPLRWDETARIEGRPHLVFSSSMADVFERHPDLPTARDRLWDLIGRTPHLIWQLLTKRPENVRTMVPLDWLSSWPVNVWVGTTVEDELRARVRIPRLVKIPAPVLFLSMEPLLGPVNLERCIDDLDWIIVGGESGGGFRPLDLDAARRIRDVCAHATVPVPFFFKQDSAYRDGTPGPPDLDVVKMFPDAACRR